LFFILNHFLIFLFLFCFIFSFFCVFFVFLFILVTSPGSEVSSRDNTGTVEALISRGKNETIPRAVHSLVACPYYSEKSYGSNLEAPTCTGRGLPTVQKN
jgi:hypothetical protein